MHTKPRTVIKESFILQPLEYIWFLRFLESFFSSIFFTLSFKVGYIHSEWDPVIILVVTFLFHAWLLLSSHTAKVISSWRTVKNPILTSKYSTTVWMLQTKLLFPPPPTWSWLHLPKISSEQGNKAAIHAPESLLSPSQEKTDHTGKWWRHDLGLHDCSKTFKF